MKKVLVTTAIFITVLFLINRTVCNNGFTSEIKSENSIDIKTADLLANPLTMQPLQQTAPVQGSANHPEIALLPDTPLAPAAPAEATQEIDASQFVDPDILKQKVDDTEVVGSKHNDSSSGAGKNALPDYYITVNKATNTVTVYKYDEKGKEVPVKAMVCSVGRAGHDTPEGEFRTYEYYDWRLMVDNTYGRYAVRFNGSIMFHSVPYFKVAKDSLEWEEYNKLGERASLGCVRLCVADAKWIYSNCKKGTKVKVYSDPKDKGPLGKPTPIKIDPKSKYKDWDPTDLTRENPLLVTIDF